MCVRLKLKKFIKKMHKINSFQFSINLLQKLFSSSLVFITYLCLIKTSLFALEFIFNICYSWLLSLNIKSFFSFGMKFHAIHSWMWIEEDHFFFEKTQTPCWVKPHQHLLFSFSIFFFQATVKTRIGYPPFFHKIQPKKIGGYAIRTRN